MLQRLRRSEAPRRFLAVVMAYLTVLGTMPAYANSSLSRTATPIKHLVVIFQENVSFDHYFGTYPNAANPQGEPAFYARPDTPTVNGLAGALLNRERHRRDQPLTGWIARRPPPPTRDTTMDRSRPQRTSA
jgi:hypothetical protein